MISNLDRKAEAEDFLLKCSTMTIIPSTSQLLRNGYLSGSNLKSYIILVTLQKSIQICHESERNDSPFICKDSRPSNKV